MSELGPHRIYTVLPAAYVVFLLKVQQIFCIEDLGVLTFCFIWCFKWVK